MNYLIFILFFLLTVPVSVYSACGNQPRALYCADTKDKGDDLLRYYSGICLQNNGVVTIGTVNSVGSEFCVNIVCNSCGDASRQAKEVLSGFCCSNFQLGVKSTVSSAYICSTSYPPMGYGACESDLDFDYNVNYCSDINSCGQTEEVDITPDDPSSDSQTSSGSEGSSSGGSAGSSGSDSGGSDRYCRDVAAELTPLLSSMIVECNNLQGTNTYSIDYFNDDKMYCITGGCNAGSSSGGSSGSVGSSASGGGSSGGSGMSSSSLPSYYYDCCRWDCFDPQLTPCSASGLSPGRQRFIFKTGMGFRLLETSPGVFVEQPLCETFLVVDRSIDYQSYCINECLYAGSESEHCQFLILSSSSNSNNSSSASGESSHSVSSSGSYSEDCYDTYAEAYESSVLTSMACFECGGIANYSVDYAEDMSKYCVRGNCSNYNQSRCPSPPSGISSNSSGGSSGSGSSNSSSSGSTNSSSSGNYGSASSSGNAFVSGPDAYYGTEDIFSSGLDNMELGKCYGLNPDRAPHYGWINTNAQDTWWWNERPCDGSTTIDKPTSNGCKHNERGENAVYTANDCFSSGLDNMEPDKCYALNPDRDTQYGWINNNAQDSWWWREVPCGEEDEDDGEEWEPVLCSGSNFLQKKSSARENNNSRESVSYDSYEVWGKNTKFYYDALGRKTQAHPETRRRLFEWKREDSVFGRDRDVVLAEGQILRMVLYDGRICGVEGKDYGIVAENGWLEGGKYCYNLDLGKNGSEKAARPIRVDDPEQLCGENDSLVNLTLKYTYTLTLKDSIYYVREGYAFPDTDYVTKPQDVIYFKKHEERHRSDARKITKTGRTGIGPKKEIFIDTTICNSEFCVWRKRVVDSLRNEILNPYKAKIDSAKEYYHDQCYNHKKC
jgi:hypothetical protein